LDGKIHAIGGSEDNVEGMVVHEVYDPATDSWSSRAPMSDPRHHLAAAALDGRIYAAAGREFGTNVGTLEIYDPDTDSWSGGPAVP
ncbi:MAG: galactose oxidase, partial [Actinobacteria bacterium]|nr:galactose oxidase [Actinomycetota bacterium]NIS34357.1 galactose oxidase [Actinomycetota bacterium]NIU65361.1 galactose oxidase [Actinomycetota bacterium]NIV89143.1 galactose oxidase [Actinomycetota bacterium]NIW30995.1 galactose oxidase [Actinomycetota bacterium]